jgi:hypothetical protein
MSRIEEVEILSRPRWWELVAEGKGVVARRGLEEAGGKSRTRRRETGYKAGAAG